MTAAIKNEIAEFCEVPRNGIGRACKDGIDFAMQYSTLAEVWDKCPRGDWMIWMLRKRGDVPLPMLIRLACACAEHVLEIYERKHPGDNRPRDAIVATMEFANNPAAAAAADAADYAYAAAAADYAADAVATFWRASASRFSRSRSAALVAAAADAADYAYAAARTSELAWQATKIRGIYGAWK